MVPHLIFWELTRICNMKCPHCRASALHMADNSDEYQGQMADDLTTKESYKLIDEIASVCSPILVLSGGEPLVRKDIYSIVEYGTKNGLKVVLGTNATLITNEVADRLKSSGIKRISVSIYGAQKDTHDDFVGQKGFFVRTMQGIENIKKAGIPLQINTTITRKNLKQIKQLTDFSINLGAEAFHIFFLVPTGRGKDYEGDEISPEEYEKIFNQICTISKSVPIQIKVTCAPHYYRVLREHSKENGTKIQNKKGSFFKMSKGCLAGTGVCFISHKGGVFPCGYFPLAAGNIRKESFAEIWFNSSLFLKLRDDSKLKGKCGICEYKKICGGCRARAYAYTDDYLEAEPYCIYQPHKRNG